MEPSQQTSFIPKKALTREASPVREAPIGLFTLLSTIIFFVSALAGGGVYFYKILLENDIKTKSNSLERAEKAFEPSTIVELERLDRRIESAKEILANHILVSPIFEFLEQTTIPNVRLSSFSYEFFDGGRATVTAHGEARSYAYVAVQSDVFGEERYIQNHVFSNLTLSGGGNVSFDLSLLFDPTLLYYKDVFARGGS